MRHLLLIALIAAWPQAASGVMVTQLHVLVPMRDGIHLAANIFRPGGTAAVPTILMRTPYGKGETATANNQAFVDHGYAVVVQDVRGRYESQGTFSPLVQEPADGDDTINWIARQPWSDGKVGMTGGSYLGISQWKVAVLNNPHLKAIFPWVSGDDDYRDRFYSTGGAMKLAHRLIWIEENLRDPDYAAPDFKKYIWTLPLRHADVEVTGKRSRMMQLIFDHPDYDAFWQSISISRQLKDMKVPVYSIGGWYDNYVESDLDAYTILRKTSSLNRIMIGPWPHNPGIPFQDVDFGRQASVGFRKLQFEWFDQWMQGKDVPLMSQPPVRIFVMGINQWRDEYEWPLARARAARYYLISGGHANGVDGDGILSEEQPKNSALDTYVYDPRNPVPTHGGSVCCNVQIFPWGPMDQRMVEKRHDVLVYTTPPLSDDVEVTGPVQVVLFAASSALDTDFTAKLVDVFPNGLARNLTDGLLRARYRNSLSKQELLTPGQIYKFKIDAGVTSNVFRKGHRIRIEISSSNFPRFDRNPNTGRPIADETELKAATETVRHDRKHASYVLLPVIPAGSHGVETLTRTAGNVPVKHVR
ncbi:MAG: X-Pro dipeptidyl-peptidase C-terminal domain protein [Bryobacterales bacterium]|nr:X-Pro dipeptidyl-peptidase C-terminal domain protein [Bryobacterales bacterium]